MVSLLQLNIRKRNASLDLARLSALFCVISVHFFLYNGFYAEPCAGWRMYLLTLLRCSFMVCIPLYLLLTGYLLNGRGFTAAHYRGIDKILGVYLLCAALCVLMKRYYFGQREVSWFSVTDFTASTYGWYVEMYLGLYLLIPLLNLVWRGLESKRKRLALLVVFLLLAHLPSVANGFDWVTPGAFADPALSQRYYMLVPRYWASLYPVSYYFIGCWLREYPVRMKKSVNAGAYLLCVAVFGSFAFYKSGSGVFISGSWQNWESLLLLPCGVLLFVFFLNLDASGWRKTPRALLAVASEVSFGAYLLSCLFDQIFYGWLLRDPPEIFARIGDLPVVFATLLLSLLASYSVTVIWMLLRRGGEITVKKLPRRGRRREAVEAKR